MGEFPFTKIQVDELVRSQKYIPSIPIMKEVNKCHRMVSSVYLEQSCERLIKLKILGQISIDPLSKSIIRPSCALLWFNQKIRGINWHLRKRNLDGEIIENWHEHIWTDKEGDNYVEPIEINSPSLEKLFIFCLNHWNIKIIEEREPLLFGEEQ